MQVHELAGKPAPREMLVNVPRLVSAYYTHRPDASDPEQRIAFGTSGHRGSSFDCSFNEDHILAIAQAICDHRSERGIAGPLYMGMDTHALSEPALASALEVFAANGVQACIQEGLGYTPTPVISRAILQWNQEKRGGDRADGVVVTPSHNPPRDGGFKYNPPHGGPADQETTKAIEIRANEILQQGLKDVRRMDYRRALRAASTHEVDYVASFATALAGVLDMEAISRSGLKMGVDPMGGSSISFWDRIAEMYDLNLELVNRTLDPAFSFIPVDRDGAIRMDCSSEYAMAGLLGMKDNYDIAWGNDPDCDRHGIVVGGRGLMNPNHYLAAAVWYLFRTRQWSGDVAVGKTVVTSSMLDRVAVRLRRRVVEVPVGFKWFVDGLLDGSLGFGGEESAGASFLQADGRVWTTDKDGFALDFLAAEMTAVWQRDPGEVYAELEESLGECVYKRLDVPADAGQKAALKGLSSENVSRRELAGEPVRDVLTRAPGNGGPIGGLKVVADNGWFAARPSGTEDIYKIYAESFRDRDHLERIIEEARELVDAVLEQSRP
jgi:phosphoglucomutase